MTALAMYGNFVVVVGLVTPDGAGQTADAITNVEGTFRIGVLSLFWVAILDVFVAWGLYLTFAPESRRLSQLAAWFQIVYAGIFVVAISNLVGVVRLLNRPGYLTVYSDQQLQALALQRYETFNDVWSARFWCSASTWSYSGSWRIAPTTSRPSWARSSPSRGSAMRSIRS